MKNTKDFLKPPVLFGGIAVQYPDDLVAVDSGENSISRISSDVEALGLFDNEKEIEKIADLKRLKFLTSSVVDEEFFTIV